jgi:hypothetical protein
MYAAQTGRAAPVEELYCIIHAPWVRSTTVRARSQFKEEVIVAESMIGTLAKQAVGGQKELDPKHILEASVIRVELNGYPTGAPAGKRASDLEVWALVSDCEPALRAEAQASLQNLFPHLNPVFRSSTRATLSVLRGRPDTEKDYLIADVASESTTLLVVREGAIAEQQLVPEGVHSILKRAAPTGMAEETLGLIRMIGRDQCSSAACEAMQTALAKIEPELVRAYGEGMAACIPLRRLPNKFILIVRPDMADWLVKFFSRIDFTQFTLTTRPFSVETVAPKDLSEWVVAAHGVTLDTGVALSTALVGREQGSR